MTEPGIFDSALLVAIVAAVFGAIPAILAYRQGRKKDAIAAQAGIATVEQGTIGQVIDGLNKLVEALQSDNEVLRSQLAGIVQKCDELKQRCEDLKQQVAALSLRLP